MREKPMIRRTLTLATMTILATAAVTAAEPRWQDKVDQWVLDSGRAGETEFLVVLADQADLSAAEAISSKAEKGEFVLRALTAAAERSQQPVLAALTARGVEVQPFWIVNMIWVRADLATVEAMARRSDVARIHANPRVRMAEPVWTSGDDPGSPESVEWNILRVNADDVWAAGTTGAGAVIGGQDTGYFWTHPALINKYRGGPAGSHDYNWHDAIHSGGGSCGANSPFPCDDYGHGTHTMGTMVGDDGAGNQVGMAPGAKWIGCRNMDQGVGTPATYAECYQWFIAPTTVGGANPDPTKAPDVINNSWGCPVSEGCTDPNVLLAVVQAVRAAGIVTVHSAGNDGWSCSSVNTPAAIYAESLSVGATDSSDSITSFSSRGPVTVDGSGRMKPNVSAPGDNVRSSTSDGGYGSSSGTSMAGPHVAGEVALLISHTPGLSGQVDLIEDIIEQTSVPHTTTEGCGGDPTNAVPNNTYGWGRIDAWAAVNYPLDYTLLVTPPTVNVCAPDSAQFQVEVGQYQGFAEPVSLTVTGGLAGATTNFSVNPVTPPGSSLLEIGNTAAVPPGSYPLQVVGTSSPSAIVHESPITFGVFSQPAGTVTLTAPANGATNQPLRPTFQWTAAGQAATYRIQVATDPTFTNPVLDVSDATGTSYTPDADLQSNTLYYWRARALNPCGAGAWSATSMFATVALPGDCGLGTVPVSAYAIDFEAGAAGWTHSGSGDSWALSGTRTHSGAAAFHANDPATTSDQRLVSPAIALPAEGAGLTLQFWNWQQMESLGSDACWDGGIVEISTNGGTTWTYLPTAVMLTDPYDGPVSGLSDVAGWCGDPQDWLKSVVDISAYAGQTAQFRFRLGSDYSVGREGWYIDDVLVQACVAGGLPFSDGFESGDSSAWSATVP
jgi:subtilisin family serine protease